MNYVLMGIFVDLIIKKNHMFEFYYNSFTIIVFALLRTILCDNIIIRGCETARKKVFPIFEFAINVRIRQFNEPL